MKRLFPDRFPLAEDHPLLEEHLLIDQYLREARDRFGSRLFSFTWESSPEKLPAFQRFSASSTGSRQRLILAVLERLKRGYPKALDNGLAEIIPALTDLYSRWIQRFAAWKPEDLIPILEAFTRIEPALKYPSAPLPVDVIFETIEKSLDLHYPTEEFQKAILALEDSFLIRPFTFHSIQTPATPAKKLRPAPEEELRRRERLRSLLEKALSLRLDLTEHWAQVALWDWRQIQETDPDAGQAWMELFRLGARLKSGAFEMESFPEIPGLLSRIGLPAFRESVERWWRWVGKEPGARAQLKSKRLALVEADPGLIPMRKSGLPMPELNVHALGILTLTISCLEPDWSSVQLSLLAERCLERCGPKTRSLKLARRVVEILATIPDPEADRRLFALKRWTHLASVKGWIQKQLFNRHPQLEDTVNLLEQLEERLNRDSSLDEKFQATAQDQLGRWVLIQLDPCLHTPIGTVAEYRSIESSRPVRPDDAIRQAIQFVQADLKDQSQRLESMIRSNPSWALKDWLEIYWNNRLNRLLASRLVWTLNDPFEERIESAIPKPEPVLTSDGRHVSSASMNDECRWMRPTGEILNDWGPHTEVRLWTPIQSDVESTLAWRRFLEEYEIRQPFKQAHREIYLLTDAERTTEYHSNRFAAHFLKQSKLRVLCRETGWKYQPIGYWNMNHGVLTCAEKRLESSDIIAHFHLQAAAGAELNTNTNTSRQNQRVVKGKGPMPVVTSDRVEFWKGKERIRLSEVPGALFSETMRDIDLFVGLSSIGADPDWGRADHSPGLRRYWRSFAFGELTETARTRKEILQRLVPHLRIASQLELSDRYLKVTGQIRAYKIHLGSGNILMEPNDEYLCIVPDNQKSGEEPVQGLPFEGDPTLSIILSKAFLLANDTRIADPVIVGQIRG